MITYTRAQRRALEAENKKMPTNLVDVPSSSWPERRPHSLLKVWRSRGFLVQEHVATHPALFRLSIARTTLNGGRWEDGISWDELQDIKNEIGFRDFCAVEIFPPEDYKVDVANMRHLWILEKSPDFMWRGE